MVEEKEHVAIPIAAWHALIDFLSSRPNGASKLDPHAKRKLGIVMEFLLPGVGNSDNDARYKKLRDLCKSFQLQRSAVSSASAGVVVWCDGAGLSSLATGIPNFAYKVVPAELHELFVLGALLHVHYGSFDVVKGTKVLSPHHTLPGKVMACLAEAGIFARAHGGAISPAYVKRTLQELRRADVEDVNSTISVTALLHRLSAAQVRAQKMGILTSLATPGFGLYPDAWVTPPSAALPAAAAFIAFHEGKRPSVVVRKATAVALLKSHVFQAVDELVARQIYFRADGAVSITLRCFRSGPPPEGAVSPTAIAPARQKRGAALLRLAATAAAAGGSADSCESTSELVV